MLRAGVVVFHLALSATLTLDLLVALGQTRLNVLWERGFYGRVSDTTALVGGLVGFALVLVATDVGVAIAWWRRRRWAATALLGLSGALLLLLPPTLGWALLACGAVITLEELRARLPPLSEVLGGDEDDR